MTREKIIDEAVRSAVFAPCFPVLARLRDDFVKGWVRAAKPKIGDEFRRISGGGTIYNTRMVSAAPIRK